MVEHAVSLNVITLTVGDRSSRNEYADDLNLGKVPTLVDGVEKVKEGIVIGNRMIRVILR